MNSRQRDKRHSWVLVALVALAVGSFVYTAVADHNRAAEQQAQLQCVTDYTTANYARQSFLQKFASPRNNAQVAYEIAKAKAEPQSKIERLRVKFIAAARAYNAASKANPLPPPPQLACGVGPAVRTPSVKPIRAPAATGHRSVVPERKATAAASSSSLPGQQPSTRTRAPTLTHTASQPSASPRPTQTAGSSHTSPPPRPNPVRSLVCGVLNPLLPCRTETS